MLWPDAGEVGSVGSIWKQAYVDLGYVAVLGRLGNLVKGRLSIFIEFSRASRQGQTEHRLKDVLKPK